MVYCESTLEVTEILEPFQSQISDLSLYYPLSETYQQTITLVFSKTKFSLLQCNFPILCIV